MDALKGVPAYRLVVAKDGSNPLNACCVDGNPFAHQGVQVDFKCRISLSRSDFGTVRGIVRIEPVGRFPFVGHSVVVGISRGSPAGVGDIAFCLELRIYDSFFAFTPLVSCGTIFQLVNQSLFNGIALNGTYLIKDMAVCIVGILCGCLVISIIVNQCSRLIITFLIKWFFALQL